jgi:hypothetical protein
VGCAIIAGGNRVNLRPPPQGHRLLPLLVIGAILWAAAATGVVWTNTLGMGERFDHLVDRVRLAVDPPPDRETLPTIEITDPLLGVEPAPDERGDERASPTPRPARKPVDVKLPVSPRRMFASQVTNDWCAVAGTQIVLAIHGVLDNSAETQRQLANRIDAWESWKDSHNGGWGPAAIAEALADHGIEGYQVRSYRRRDLALRDAAVALSTTRAPVILIAWRGAHTWIMTGYRADADPSTFRDATITGAYVYDPWYPRVSTIWGPSDPPGVFQDTAELERNYLRWERPEGEYVERDGMYIAVVPTIPLKKQPTVRR